MTALIGFLVVIGSVLGGFSIAGGKIPALFHVSEIIVVAGTALGTILVSTPAPTLKALMREIPMVIRPTPFNSSLYLDGLKLLFELFQTAQRDGLVAIESHVEDPHQSPLFGKYPKVLQHHHAVQFLSDSLRLVLLGGVSPHDLDMMLESDIEVQHEQEEMSVKVLQRVSDALPGIGIVAAVLGIVVTMGAINGPIERIGEHVAAALTGTFLGVLLAYGFTGPLANGLEGLKGSETRFYYFLKAGIVALAKGASPLIAVEFARRSIFSEVRPTFGEMEAELKALKRKTSTEEVGETAKAA
jgi:chemotaxis protein MotA